MIKVDMSKCLGCFSCSNVCPSQNINRTETPLQRSIHWKKCKEECDLCVEFCPAKALTLVPYEEDSPEPDVSFDLAMCNICGSRYATEPMLKRIEASLPSNLQVDSTGLAWIRVCPICRRNIEAERATKQIIIGRSRKRP
jgi:ferredoxin